ncbi:MAG TPA: zinc ribbon domain-containing protein [Burkholderiales bacterium]|jgi:putative FmdB family regulatory protein|nr:zinc ribbon domain-containing protein [Burkholderiales bacterium]
MPIFEYACRGCGHEFETLVRASDTPACTQCAGTDLEKKLSVFASQTSGSTVDAAPSPCGSCGHPGGPGSCALN